MTMKISICITTLTGINIKSEFDSRWHKDLGITGQRVTEIGNIPII